MLKGTKIVKVRYIDFIYLSLSTLFLQDICLMIVGPIGCRPYSCFCLLLLLLLQCRPSSPFPFPPLKLIFCLPPYRATFWSATLPLRVSATLQQRPQGSPRGCDCEIAIETARLREGETVRWRDGGYGALRRETGKAWSTWTCWTWTW